jgi:threonine 3-dehydrogenase
MESFLLSGRLRLDPIVTHQLDLQDFDRGFKLMQSGEAIKVVLKIPRPFEARFQSASCD